MVFVELTPFVAFREQYWADEDLRALQNVLLITPDAGALLEGGGGLRKIRRPAQGRGTRGGARIIYYWLTSQDRIYLIYGYVKSKQDDLAPKQIEILAKLLKDIE